MRAAWKKLRYRLEYVGLLLAAKIVPSFPGPPSRRWRRSSVRSHRLSICVAGALPWPISIAPFPGNIRPPRMLHHFAESYQHFCPNHARPDVEPRLTPKTFLRYIEFEDFPRSIRTKAELWLVFTTATSNGPVWVTGFVVVPAPSSLRNSRTHCSIQFSDAGGSSPAMSSVRARAECFDFSKLCAVAAISRC